MLVIRSKILEGYILDADMVIVLHKRLEAVQAEEGTKPFPFLVAFLRIKGQDAIFFAIHFKGLFAEIDSKYLIVKIIDAASRVSHCNASQRRVGSLMCCHLYAVIGIRSMCELALSKLRKMILCNTDDERKAALAELEPYMKAAVKETLRVMDGKPVVFRLLDPPLHEFVPGEDKKKELAKDLGISVKEVEKRGESLHEVNPMMGHRGVRLHVSFPLIAETQYRAIFTATAELQKEGLHPHPEIMIPVTISARELSFQKVICDRIKAEVETRTAQQIDYQFGTMIEIPRAALTADRMARTAEFFSFGTNDLTQMTFGFSRDDIGTFMGDYLGNKILDSDPFQTIDVKAVGQLVKIGVERGRSKRSELQCGICGEHGGDPASIEFFNAIGIDYVSCSPFRVPIARLAAAQAQIKQSK